MDKQQKDNHIKYALQHDYAIMKRVYSHGEKVLKHRKRNRYISIDCDSHIGGIWKMATSVERLRDKHTRDGTYDAFLERIGD